MLLYDSLWPSLSVLLWKIVWYLRWKILFNISDEESTCSESRQKQVLLLDLLLPTKQQLAMHSGRYLQISPVEILFEQLINSYIGIQIFDNGMNRCWIESGHEKEEYISWYPQRRVPPPLSLHLIIEHWALRTDTLIFSWSRSPTKFSLYSSIALAYTPTSRNLFSRKSCGFSTNFE